MSDNTKQEYLLPEREKEIARLTEQDAVITHVMDNTRILAPIDLTMPGLKMLDSGTANGLFLRSIQPLLTEPYTLLGYDVMPSFFPPATERPANTTFAIHDIAEAWPAELHGTCDLVHQRFTIPGGTQKATPRDIVRHLCQLVEMDVTGGTLPHGPAMRDAWAVTGAFLTAAGAGTDYAKNMAGWLREEGLESVEDKQAYRHRRRSAVQEESCVGPAWCQDVDDILCGGVVGACKLVNVNVPQVDLDKLPQRAEEEMVELGGIYPLVFASARKPAVQSCYHGYNCRDKLVGHIYRMGAFYYA